MAYFKVESDEEETEMEEEETAPVSGTTSGASDLELFATLEQPTPEPKKPQLSTEVKPPEKKKKKKKKKTKDLVAQVSSPPLEKMPKTSAKKSSDGKQAKAAAALATAQANLRTAKAELKEQKKTVAAQKRKLSAAARFGQGLSKL